MSTGWGHCSKKCVINIIQKKLGTDVRKEHESSVFYYFLDVWETFQALFNQVNFDKNPGSWPRNFNMSASTVSSSGSSNGNGGKGTQSTTSTTDLGYSDTISISSGSTVNVASTRILTLCNKGDWSVLEQVLRGMDKTSTGDIKQEANIAEEVSKTFCCCCSTQKQNKQKHVYLSLMLNIMVITFFPLKVLYSLV